ncbi:uncharacterized protein ACNLHF_017818 [Anomaloglossus baeobatrachus]
MKVVVATCTCLFLARLAVFQKSNSCNITTEMSACQSFKTLRVSHTIKGMQKHNSRIIISNHHFKMLNTIPKICLLKKIMGLYENMTSYTKEVSKEISALEVSVRKFMEKCLNCTICKTFRIRKPFMKCKNYSTSMVLNQTQIMHCQEWLLKNANKTIKKGKKHAKQIQQKLIYEFDILQDLVTEAHQRHILNVDGE